MNSCPQCGERIEVTVPIYLTDVSLNDEGEITGFNLDFEYDQEHGGAFDWESGSARVYCKNDHQFEYMGITPEAMQNFRLQLEVK